MLKHKKILLLSLLVPVFIITSCKKPKEPYNVYKQSGDEENHLTVTAELPSIKSGKKIPIDKITVTYNSQPKEWLNNSKDYKQDKFFIVTSKDYPTNSIKTNLEVTSNVEKIDLKFYVAYFNSDEKIVYVSKTLKITITNDNVIKPWVWYTVTAVVVFGVVGMVMFVRHRKLKSEEK